MMRYCEQTGLPLGPTKSALAFAHFPTRYQAFIWRNWGLLSSERLGRVLSCDAAAVEAAAGAMGLCGGADADREALWLQRGYLTLIRQNWHLLPYSQLLDLLGWPAEQLAYVLKEDDFLWNKMGNLKPGVETVFFHPLSAEQERQTAWIRETMQRLAPQMDGDQQAPFAFLEYRERNSTVACGGERIPDGGLRMVYSYSAVYGDPLLDPELDPYPDGLLAGLSARGVNAVWLQGVLYTLTASFGETPYARDRGVRLHNLAALVAKAARHGIKVYLYINEPRGMPVEFFKDHPEWRGGLHSTKGLYAMCTSNPEVLERLRDGVAEVVRAVPDLGGVFTISMSENLTHCRSKYAAVDPCPRCDQRNCGHIVADVNNAIADGVYAANPQADVIVWDWSWGEDDWAKEAIDRLRPQVKLMCTSEAYLPTDAQDVSGYVCDYSMSKVGPGPFARELWQHARARGLEVLAKVQINNTWECSAVPYLPVPYLVKEHLNNLRKEGVSGFMAAWTLGGYPGGNLELFDREPEELARRWFGEAAVEAITKAWHTFGEAFREFPLHGARCLYRGPQNYGPTNLLFAEPTGYEPTMVGFPYDDVDCWRGNHYPADVFEDQFRKLSDGWNDGLEFLNSAAGQVPPELRANFEDLQFVAEAAYCHFRSAYLQIRFNRLRDAADGAASRELIDAVLDEEIAVARRLITVAARDSRIGFEASNHYYYTAQSLLEKMLNCEYLRSGVE